MTETPEQTLERLRVAVAGLDAEAAGIRAEGVIAGGVTVEQVARQIQIANERSTMEKAIAALTVGKMRTV